MDNTRKPAALSAILKDTAAAGFDMPSDAHTGQLLRVLAASRPAARVLELGTGTGLSAAWILDGLDADSTLDSVDSDPDVVEVARRHLGTDLRLRLHVADGGPWLRDAEPGRFDLLFADAWPGKYNRLDAAVAALRVGGLYVVDDMLPQPDWPVGHGEQADGLRQTLSERADLRLVELRWSTGLILCSKVA